MSTFSYQDAWFRNTKARTKWSRCISSGFTGSVEMSGWWNSFWGSIEIKWNIAVCNHDISCCKGTKCKSMTKRDNCNASRLLAMLCWWSDLCLPQSPLLTLSSHFFSMGSGSSSRSAKWARAARGSGWVDCSAAGADHGNDIVIG